MKQCERSISTKTSIKPIEGLSADMQIFSRTLLSTSAIRVTHRSLFALLSSSSQTPKMTELCLDVSKQLRIHEEKRSLASERSWELNASLVRVEMLYEQFIKCPTNEDELKSEEENLEYLIKDTVLSTNYYNNIVRDTAHTMKMEVRNDDNAPHPRAPRLDNISTRIEDFARYKSVRHYFATGTLISSSAFVISDCGIERSIVTDEEYLAGACIGLCHDLAKYCITHAGNAGVDPSVVIDVQKARDIVAKILEELLQFDFRNSPLRRKYDTTKYALKSLETILYELSIATTLRGSDVKKAKLDGSGVTEISSQDDLIPLDDFLAIRARMDHRDHLRERLIKTCRDGQKAAKQAIFALHRGDTARALKLLNDCENCVTTDLMPILHEEPELRGGSFSGVLEEYVEACLFHSWLQNDVDGKKNEPSGAVLPIASLPLSVSPEEYLGGLCDLSGEIGRFAVARGTARDKKDVQLCLETNKKIYNALRLIGKLPGIVFKKKNALKMSVEKLERIVYELNLMEMSGKNQYVSSLENSRQADEE